MTVSSTTSKVEYLADGVTTLFPVTFYYLEDSHVAVTKTLVADETDRAELVYDTDFTVDSDGNVVISPAVATGYRLTITRAVPLTQLLSLTNQGTRFPENDEAAFDRLTMITQQIQEEVDRCVKVPLGSDDDAGDAVAAAAASAAAAAASAAAAAASAAAAEAAAAGLMVLESEEFVATDGQTDFILTEFTYVFATPNLSVTVDGLLLSPSAITPNVDGVTVTIPPCVDDADVVIYQSVGLGANAVGTGALVDGCVTNAKLAGDADPSKIVLAGGKFIIGGIAGQGAARSITGDVEINYLGTSTLNDETINIPKLDPVELYEVTKDADEDAVSSTTLHDDDELTFDVVADSWYNFEIHAFIQALSDGGEIKVGVNGPGALVAGSRWHVTYWNQFATAVATGTILEAYDAALSRNYGAHFKSLVTIKGALQATANGTVAFRWAQLSSNPIATTVLAGSSLKAWRTSGSYPS